ncbi:MAG: aminotransferase class I/II-fold pyridoxal phosphate-dependent enzyme [Desulfobacteraceae bacterium]|nr:MAG: aminotransferase class I/II-fold pyridoxal phosphate-dependent enzyme [Desulfobacteraceae bacterium]
MSISSKLPAVGLTIFTEMTNLANAHGAINLSQGFPEFDPHPALQELVLKHMRAGRNQYAPMQGVLALRERISAKVRDLYHAPYDPATEITITAGATEALFAAITAVVHPGEEVIILEPAYDCYLPMVSLSGGRPVFVPLHYPSYRIDWQAFQHSITPRTRLAILNFPHNPSGSVIDPRDLDRLAEILRGTRVLLLSDEVYEHIVFDGRAHCSLAGHPELRERTFVVSSFAKTCHATGWKVGYCLAPRPLSAELQKIHQYLVFSVNTPMQHAFADFLQNPGPISALAAHYQSLRDFFLGRIAGSRFRPLPCHGTFFLMLAYDAISDEPDVAFARRLTREHGVAAIPPSVFYHNGEDHRVLRFCFAKTHATLAEAAERLCRI